MKLAVQKHMIPGTTFSERLQKAETYGFEGMEMGGGDPDLKLDVAKEALSISKVRVSTILSGPGGDLLGSDRKERETAIEKIKDRLKTAAEVGAVGVITVPTFGGPKIPDLYPWQADIKKLEKEILVEEYRILGKYAEDVGVFVILEPLNRYETHFIQRLEQAIDICETVGLEHIKMMADFFHMNIEEPDIPSSLEKAKDHLVHIHLADSNRVLPGYGHTDFKSGFAVLKKTGYKNFMALECGIPGDSRVELPKCVRHLRNLM